MLAWLILDHPRTLLAQTTLLHNSEAPLEAKKIIALKGSTAPRPDHQLLPLLVFFLKSVVFRTEPGMVQKR